MAQRRAEFEKHNAQVVVIVSQDRYRIAQWNQNPPLAFPVLADPLAWAAARYGLARRLLLHDEWVSMPAAFVADVEGVVRFTYIGRGYADRVEPEALLQALAALKP